MYELAPPREAGPPSFTAPGHMPRLRASSHPGGLPAGYQQTTFRFRRCFDLMDIPLFWIAHDPRTLRIDKALGPSREIRSGWASARGTRESAAKRPMRSETGRASDAGRRPSNRLVRGPISPVASTAMQRRLAERGGMNYRPHREVTDGIRKEKIWT